MDVILLAAGKSSRMGRIKDKNKVYMNIFGHPAIMYPVFIFSQFKEISENGKIIITYNKEQYEHTKDIFNNYKFNIELVEGGNSRQESVYNALKYVKSDKVLIHDGARVCITKKIVKNMIDDLNNHDAVVVGIKATDTLKRIEDGIVKETLNRENIYKIQTPQGFKTKLIIESLELVRKNRVNITDDASAVEYMGKTIHVIDGSEENIKLTNKADYMLAKAILYKRITEKKSDNFLDGMRR